MTKEDLKNITTWLRDYVIENSDVMFNDIIRGASTPDHKFLDLVEVIVYLHNRLCECIEGEPYDYMFHWANKIGSYARDVAELSECLYDGEETKGALYSRTADYRQDHI